MPQAELGQAIIQFIADTKEFQADMRRVTGQFRQYEQSTTKVNQANRKLSSSSRLSATSLLYLGTAAAAAFVGATLFVRDQARLGTELLANARRTGIAANNLQRLQFVFERIGVAADNTVDVLREVSVAVSDAGTSATSDKAEGFARLGIDLTRIRREGTPVIEILAQIADSIQSIGSQERTGILDQIFGDQGTAILPALERGREDFLESIAEVDALTGINSLAAIQSLAELDMSYVRLSQTVRVSLGQAVSEVSGELNDALGSLQESLPRILTTIIRFGALIVNNIRGLSIAVGLLSAAGLATVLSRWVVGLRATIVATQGATVATRAFNFAIAANPIGFAIGAITLGTAAYLNLTSAIGEASDAQKGFGRESAASIDRRIEELRKRSEEIAQELADIPKDIRALAITDVARSDVRNGPSFGRSSVRTATGVLVREEIQLTLQLTALEDRREKIAEAHGRELTAQFGSVQSALKAEERRVKTLRESLEIVKATGVEDKASLIRVQVETQARRNIGRAIATIADIQANAAQASRAITELEREKIEFQKEGIAIEEEGLKNIGQLVREKQETLRLENEIAIRTRPNQALDSTIRSLENLNVQNRQRLSLSIAISRAESQSAQASRAFYQGNIDAAAALGAQSLRSRATAMAENELLRLRQGLEQEIAQAKRRQLAAIASGAALQQQEADLLLRQLTAARAHLATETARGTILRQVTDTLIQQETIQRRIAAQQQIAAAAAENDQARRESNTQQQLFESRAREFAQVTGGLVPVIPTVRNPIRERAREERARIEATAAAESEFIEKRKDALLGVEAVEKQIANLRQEAQSDPRIVEELMRAGVALEAELQTLNEITVAEMERAAAIFQTLVADQQRQNQIEDFADAEMRLAGIIDDTTRAGEEFTRSLINGFDSVGEAAIRLGQTILNSLVDNLVVSPIVGALSSALTGALTGGSDSSKVASLFSSGAGSPGGFIPGRAAGGRAQGLTVVGEEGPELADFNQPARVYPTDVLADVLRGMNSANRSGETMVFSFAPIIQTGDAEAVNAGLARAFPLFRDTITEHVVSRLSTPTTARRSVLKY